MYVVYKIVNYVNNKYMYEENKLINVLLEC